MTKWINSVLILINIGLAVSGQVAIKSGMKQVGYIHAENALALFLKAFTNWYVIIGLAAYFIAAATWILVLSRVDLSYAYPMLSLGYIVVLIISAVWLGEAVTLPRIIGTILIVGGVGLIFTSSS